MRRVLSRDTTAEKKVRSLLHSLGFRFRLHREDLPGKPDIVLPKYSSVIFVHGCFWHRHEGCRRASMPATRQDYWVPKFKRTVERDRQTQRELRRLGWNVIIVWECQLRDQNRLAHQLKSDITNPKSVYRQGFTPAKMAAEGDGTYRSTGK
ncbi:MAG: DNA mismatch endonuclease Vsr [Proteobacteria bacterium]|nr:DNA mismatch endonuclease Vsr [Pseudomonadota bacterium]